MPEERTGLVTLRGNPVTLTGPEIKVGQQAPDFAVVDNGLQTVQLSDAKGKVLILSSVPSVDTPVCDTETRRFNQEAGSLGDGIEVWTISVDLPFAQKRWCAAAGIDRVKTFSDFRGNAFSSNYGVLMSSGPLTGIGARAVFVVGKNGQIKYVEYVSDIANEPDYNAALNAAKEAGAEE
jgi:thiol peroxidase